MEFADRKDFDVNDFKKNFAEVTKQEVETFKGKIKDEYDQYMSKGPGTPSVSLEEGAELLTASKDKIRSFNRIREENVLAEKLFNLPISKFPELIGDAVSNTLKGEGGGIGHGEVDPCSPGQRARRGHPHSAAAGCSQAHTCFSASTYAH